MDEGLTSTAQMVVSLVESRLTFTGQGDANIFSGRFRISPKLGRIYFFYIENMPLFVETVTINGQLLTLDMEGLHAKDSTNRVDALV